MNESVTHSPIVVAIIDASRPNMQENGSDIVIASDRNLPPCWNVFVSSPIFEMKKISSSVDFYTYQELLEETEIS